ncbi:UvrB/UvrC motif-containing protein [Latilactobacillus curvatus]
MTNEIDFDSMSKAEKLEMVERLSEQMRNAAKKLDFEQAATLRDTILEIKSEID